MFKIRVKKQQSGSRAVAVCLVTGTQLLILIIDATWNVNAC